jgi:putative spermidine/putrescine transport system ATP-binding protein
VEIDPAKGKYPNLFEGKVKELIYLGDHIRTRVQVCGHDDFIVKVPNTSNHASLIEGHKVNVGWKSDDCRALDIYQEP